MRWIFKDLANFTIRFANGSTGKTISDHSEEFGIPPTLLIGNIKNNILPDQLSGRMLFLILSLPDHGIQFTKRKPWSVCSTVENVPITSNQVLPGLKGKGVPSG